MSLYVSLIHSTLPSAGKWGHQRIEEDPEDEDRNVEDCGSTLAFVPGGYNHIEYDRVRTCLQKRANNADEDGDGKEGFDIPAGLGETDSFTVAAEEIAEYKEEVRGQSVRLDVIFNFETIPDFTATVYIDFV